MKLISYGIFGPAIGNQSSRLLNCISEFEGVLQSSPKSIHIHKAITLETCHYSMNIWTSSFRILFMISLRGVRENMFFKNSKWYTLLFPYFIRLQVASLFPFKEWMFTIIRIFNDIIFGISMNFPRIVFEGATLLGLTYPIAFHSLCAFYIHQGY